MSNDLDGADVPIPTFPPVVVNVVLLSEITDKLDTFKVLLIDAPPRTVKDPPLCNPIEFSVDINNN